MLQSFSLCQVTFSDTFLDETFVEIPSILARYSLKSYQQQHFLFGESHSKEFQSHMLIGQGPSAETLPNPPSATCAI